MIKNILAFFENITNKQAIVIIFFLTIFLSINTFIIIKHNDFYSYIDNSVDSYIDLVQYYTYVRSLNEDISFHTFNLKDILSSKPALIKNINTLSVHINNIITKRDTFVSNWKPPFFFVFSSLMLFATKEVLSFTIFLNSILIFLNLFLVYNIIKNLESVKAGLLTSFILSFTPLFFCAYRSFFLETLYVTFILLLFFLIYKYNFNNIFSCLFFVLILTLAILTKQQIFLYFPIFFLFEIYKQKYIDIKKIFILFVLILCSFIISYFLWYYHNFSNVFAELLKYSKETWNYERFYYIKSLFCFDISYILFIFFLISIIFCFIKKNKKSYPFILSFVYIFFLFLFFSKNSMSRHILPIIPFVAMVVSLFVFSINNTAIRKSFIMSIVLILFVQYILVNYSNIFMEGNFYKYNFFKGLTYYKYLPEKETCKQDYEQLKQIFGNNFENNTIFVEYPPIVYDYFIIQKKDKDTLCKLISYDDFFNYDLSDIENIVIKKPKNLDLLMKIKSYLAKNNYYLLKSEQKYDYKTLEYKRYIFYYQKRK